MSPTILIVDDEKHTREGLRAALEDRFDVYVAADIPGAINVLENDTIDLMVTDLRLGGEDGMQLIDRALRLPHPPICIMMTAYGSVDTAVEAMKHGAYDFVTKPINIDRLEILIQRALQGRETEKENRELKQQVEKHFGLENLIGNSAVMQEVFDTVKQIAPTRATVLIEGESGTGKELVAHAIHHLSNRNKAEIHRRPLRRALRRNCSRANCSATKKGPSPARPSAGPAASSRPTAARFSSMKSARSTPTPRSKSSARSIPASSSASAATRPSRPTCGSSPPPTRTSKKWCARENSATISFTGSTWSTSPCPRLRDRKEDIPLLVNAFLKSFAQRERQTLRELTADAMQALLAYDWPGNVRELRTAVEHGVVMATGPRITLRDLPGHVRQAAGWQMPASGSRPRSPTTSATPADRLIDRALAESNGNVTEAARKLGISRRTLHRKLNAFRAADPRRNRHRQPGRIHDLERAGDR